MIAQTGADADEAAAPALLPPNVPHGYLLTTLDYDLADAADWPEHRHVEHELLWSDAGVVRLRAAGRVWAVPPTLAVWVPAGVSHAVAADAGARVRATYFVDAAANVSAMPRVITGVAMTEPLRVLLTHNLQGDLLDEAARLRLQRVILDLLVPAPQESFALVMPTSMHLLPVARAILADPADRRTTADWAVACGVHPRTLARQFATETGTTLTQWRVLARLQLAIKELSRGRSVVSISRTIGYRNPSTFIDHFRELTGQTPAEYLRGARAGSAS
ncbi:AraC family transcriptional regulator [Leucobacter japonicus]|uniref:AraC family transcriptional regulator n=1 Tax=Leucobacter japonicus TaxID=1461259 RepID=UPI0006A7A217|nr:AraC family transcriptional regulator [Leucobacter japonicus]